MILLHFLLFVLPAAWASDPHGCVLDFPDQDVRRIYPESTRFRVRDLIPSRHSKNSTLKNDLEKALRSKLDEEFESLDHPHTFYVVYKGDEYIGLIHGTNARAYRGPMQVFVAYEKNGNVRDVYVQKMSSKEAPAFRDKRYTEQFKAYGINRDEFEYAFFKPPQRNPSSVVLKDHERLLRAVKLNFLWIRFFYNKFTE